MLGFVYKFFDLKSIKMEETGNHLRLKCLYISKFLFRSPYFAIASIMKDMKIFILRLYNYYIVKQV
jgi:hypothetical protein